MTKWGADKNRILVHRMGVDLDRFVYEPKNLIDGKEKIILSVGRFVEKKGFEHAIKAIYQLRKKTRIKFKYIIVGSGELNEKMEKLVKSLDLVSVVKF